MYATIPTLLLLMLTLHTYLIRNIPIALLNLEYLSSLYLITKRYLFLVTRERDLVKISKFIWQNGRARLPPLEIWKFLPELLKTLVLPAKLAVNERKGVPHYM